MRYTPFILVLALAVGCSKHSSDQPAIQKESQQLVTRPHSDLGVVELTPGVPKRLSFDRSKTCIIVGTPLPNGTVQLDVAVEATNTDGTIQRSSAPKFASWPERACAVSVGDVSIGLTPKLQTP